MVGAGVQKKSSFCEMEPDFSPGIHAVNDAFQLGSNVKPIDRRGKYEKVSLIDDF